MVFPILNNTLFAAMRLWVRRVEGLKNVPLDGPFIIVANHGSFADDLMLHANIISRIKKHIHIYVNSHFFKNRLFRWFLDHGECIPIQVGNKKKNGSNKKAFKDAIRYLKKGEPVGIFPEGHRSFPDKMREGRTGALRLALTAKVPIVPMGIEGSRKVLPKGSMFPRLKRVNIRFGKPIYLDKYYKDANNKKVLKKLTNDVMRKVAKLARDKYDY